MRYGFELGTLGRDVTGFLGCLQMPKAAKGLDRIFEGRLMQRMQTSEESNHLHLLHHIGCISFLSKERRATINFISHFLNTLRILDPPMEG